MISDISPLVGQVELRWGCGGPFKDCPLASSGWLRHLSRPPLLLPTLLLLPRKRPPPHCLRSWSRIRASLSLVIVRERGGTEAWWNSCWGLKSPTVVTLLFRPINKGYFHTGDLFQWFGKWVFPQFLTALWSLCVPFQFSLTFLPSFPNGFAEKCWKKSQKAWGRLLCIWEGLHFSSPSYTTAIFVALGKSWRITAHLSRQYSLE